MAKMIWRVVAVLMLYHTRSANTQRAVILSGPSSVNATLNSTVEFHCNVTGLFVEWLINGADEDTTNLKDRVHSIDEKQQSGGQEIIVSIFYVPATIDFNNSRIQCEVAGTDRVRKSTAAIFRIQGLLDAPSASVTSSGVSNTHTLEWLPPFTLDTEESEDITHYSVCTNITGCLDLPHNQTSFQFPSICEPLEFKVSAFNVLGRGGSTSVIFSAEPSNSVEITAGSVKTEVFFITRHETGLTIILSGIKGDCFELSRLTVMEVDDSGVAIDTTDVGYIFPVVGTNETIVLTTPPRLLADHKYQAFLNITTVTDGIEFSKYCLLGTQGGIVNNEYDITATIQSIVIYKHSTFDVQAVDVVFHQQLREVEITCEFARGSLSTGCNIELSHATHNETRPVLRNRDNTLHFLDTASYSFALSENGLYCVSVYDIEADGTISSLQVYQNCSNVTLPPTPEGSTMASVITPSALPEPGPSTSMVVILTVVLPIIVVTTVVAVIIITTCVYFRKKQREADSHRKTDIELRYAGNQTKTE